MTALQCQGSPDLLVLVLNTVAVPVLVLDSDLTGVRVRVPSRRAGTEYEYDWDVGGQDILGLDAALLAEAQFPFGR